MSLHQIVETVLVVSDNPAHGGFVRINKTEFDPDTMTLFEPEAQEGAGEGEGEGEGAGEGEETQSGGATEPGTEPAPGAWGAPGADAPPPPPIEPIEAAPGAQAVPKGGKK